MCQDLKLRKVILVLTDLTNYWMAWLYGSELSASSAHIDLLVSRDPKFLVPRYRRSCAIAPLHHIWPKLMERVA
jgi:hypothetical protein